MSKRTAFTDAEVLAAIRSGNEHHVLDYLYRSLRSRVRQYILNNNGNDDEAADIFQEAIIAFYKQVKLGKYDERYEIGGFVYSVARNLWINRTRRLSKQSALPEQLDSSDWVATGTEADVSDRIISQEREQFILSLFEGLGERCKDLLVQTIFHNLSMKEIAATLGFATEDAAKTKHYKCKQRLIAQVKDNTYVLNTLKGL